MVARFQLRNDGWLRAVWVCALVVFAFSQRSLAGSAELVISFPAIQSVDADFEEAVYDSESTHIHTRRVTLADTGLGELVGIWSFRTRWDWYDSTGERVMFVYMLIYWDNAEDLRVRVWRRGGPDWFHGEFGDGAPPTETMSAGVVIVGTQPHDGPDRPWSIQGPGSGTDALVIPPPGGGGDGSGAPPGWYSAPDSGEFDQVVEPLLEVPEMPEPPDLDLEAEFEGLDELTGTGQSGELDLSGLELDGEPSGQPWILTFEYDMTNVWSALGMSWSGPIQFQADLSWYEDVGLRALVHAIIIALVTWGSAILLMRAMRRA